MSDVSLAELAHRLNLAKSTVSARTGRAMHCGWLVNAVFVKGRRKGKGAKGQVIPLTTAGLEALRQFDALDCWGTFSTSSVWQSFQRACAKLGLSGLRPYDLRHTFGTAVYATTGDLRATQHLLGHASRVTTDRYTLAAVPERLQVAVGQVEHLQQAPKIVAVRSRPS